jgi:hypothetical protein
MLKIAPANHKNPDVFFAICRHGFSLWLFEHQVHGISGSEVFQGAGGSVRVVDGIDFWENGDSNRKYKILGVIDESHKHGYLPGHLNRLFSDSGDRESAIAKAAHKQGGDAVIFVARAQEPSSVDQYGNGHHRRSTELVVIKYVDEPKPY